MKPMLTCREVESFIASYLDGTLPIGRSILFRLHLMMCKQCRAYIRSYKTARELVVRTLAPPEADASDRVPAELIAAILAARGGATE